MRPRRAGKRRGRGAMDEFDLRPDRGIGGCRGSQTASSTVAVAGKRDRLLLRKQGLQRQEHVAQLAIVEIPRWQVKQFLPRSNVSNVVLANWLLPRPLPQVAPISR